MLARPAEGPFDSEDWIFEIKWDGIRAIAYVGDTLSLRSRNDREIAGQFPELGELLRLAPGTVLDGEIIAMVNGRPDIQAILPRLQSGNARPPVHLSNPVTYIVFDILEKDGESLVDLPLIERQKILRQSVIDDPRVTVSVPVESRGTEYYRVAISRGLEGVVAKQKDSRYEPGARSGTWLKIKQTQSCDCVIVGYTIGQGGRGPLFGALLLGLYETGQKKLVYIGKVGSGFSDRELNDLMAMFQKIRTDGPTVTGSEQGDQIVWLKPVMVAEVEYQQATRDTRLRIPRFIRIRPDKKPEECTLDQLAELRIHPEKTGKPASGVDSPTGITGDTGDTETTGHLGGKKSREPNEQQKSYQEQSLETYHEKRNLSKSPEPGEKIAMTTEGNYFVIHEHHARHLHFDLRLERGGVLKSWAVPKGIPEVPGEKHLAVAVEDHPLEYGHFEGTIPEGEYGAGKVSIWDNGTYDTKLWEDSKIEIIFHGKRLAGHYVLVPFKRAGKNEWLIFKAS